MTQKKRPHTLKQRIRSWWTRNHDILISGTLGGLVGYVLMESIRKIIQ